MAAVDFKPPAPPRDRQREADAMATRKRRGRGGGCCAAPPRDRQDDEKWAEKNYESKRLPPRAKLPTPKPTPNMGALEAQSLAARPPDPPGYPPPDRQTRLAARPGSTPSPPAASTPPPPAASTSRAQQTMAPAASAPASASAAAAAVGRYACLARPDPETKWYDGCGVDSEVIVGRTVKVDSGEAGRVVDCRTSKWTSATLHLIDTEPDEERGAAPSEFRLLAQGSGVPFAVRDTPSAERPWQWSFDNQVPKCAHRQCR